MNHSTSSGLRRRLRNAALVMVGPIALALAVPATGATITLRSKADSGPGSLRQAVADAVGGDTIAVPAGVYPLQSPITVNKSLTIAGAGARSTVLDGKDATQILSLQTPAALVRITGVTMRRGHAAAGGAVNSEVALEIEDSALVGNTATVGGGGALSVSAKLTLRRVLLAGNSAANDGGAIYFSGPVGSTSVIQDSTIANNSSATGGGGFSTQNVGGAYSVNVSGSTLVGNAATGAAATGGHFRAGSNSTVRLRNTYLGSGVAQSGGNCYEAGGAFVVSLGFNAEDASSVDCHFTQPSDRQNLSAMLGALADNGGPTDTMLPAVGSPLIDTGGAGACTPSDERGALRPQGAGCDVGAVERTSGPVMTAPNVVALAGTSAVLGASVDTRSLDGNLTVDVGTDLSYGTSVTAVVAGGTVGPQPASVTVTGLVPGATYHYRLSVRTGDGVATASDAVFTTPVVTPAPTPTPTSPPALAVSMGGAGTLGSRMTCVVVGGVPAGRAFSWLRDGAPITGAVGQAYSVTWADQGHGLACRVTDVMGTATAPAVRLPQRLAVKLARRVISVRRGVRVPVRLTTTRSATATLVVRRGGKVIGRVRGKVAAGTRRVVWSGRIAGRSAPAGRYAVALTLVVPGERVTVNATITVG